MWNMEKSFCLALTIALRPIWKHCEYHESNVNVLSRMLGSRYPLIPIYEFPEPKRNIPEKYDPVIGIYLSGDKFAGCDKLKHEYFRRQIPATSWRANMQLESADKQRRGNPGAMYKLARQDVAHYVNVQARK